jgi:hypothetical protein
VQVGNLVRLGQTLSAAVPHQTHVVADFKETRLTHIRVGQPVTIAVDAFPDLNNRLPEEVPVRSHLRTTADKRQPRARPACGKSAALKPRKTTVVGFFWRAACVPPPRHKAPSHNLRVRPPQTGSHGRNFGAT